MRRALTALPLLLLAGLLALHGAAPAFAERTGGAHHRSPARVTVIGVSTKGQEHRGQHFAVDRLSSLVIRVHWKTLVGQQSQRLELITPDGAVYQRFTADVGDVNGEATVDTRVPVVGSWIAQYHLVGTWKVRVYLGESTAPSAAASFTLTQ